MSEVMGYVLAYFKNDRVKSDYCKEFQNSEEITIKEQSFHISRVKVTDIVDFEVTTSEYGDESALGNYIRQKYDVDVFISSFEDEAFIGAKSVSREKALKKIAAVSPAVEFYLYMEQCKYKKAHAMLVDGKIQLTDRVAGIPVYEYCFYGTYAPLMEHAIDNGYHNHRCVYKEHFSGQCYEQGTHVLHRVLSTSNIDLVKKTLAMGGDPNGWDEGSEVAVLHNIGWYQYCDDYKFDTVELLTLFCEAGADVNKLNGDGETPLQAFVTWVISHQKNEVERKYIFEVVSKFIDFGAKVDVFDELGVGLLGSLKNVEGMKALLTSRCPGLKSYAEGFDCHQYILSQYRNLSGLDDPVQDVDYFLGCFLLGFIDFAFEEDRLRVLKKFSAHQYFKLIDALMKNPEAVTALTLMHEAGLPVFIFYDHYKDWDDSSSKVISNCNSVDVAKYHERNDIVEFYKSIEGSEYPKIKISDQRIGMPEYDYKICS